MRLDDMEDDNSVNIRVTNKVNLTEKVIDASIVFGALFTGLKLAGIDDVSSWPWSLVLLPLYIVPLIIVIGFTLIALMGAVVVIVKHVADAFGSRQSRIEVSTVTGAGDSDDGVSSHK